MLALQGWVKQSLVSGRGLVAVLMLQVWFGVQSWR